MPSYIVLVLVTLGVPMIASLVTERLARLGLMVGWFAAWAADVAFRLGDDQYSGAGISFATFLLICALVAMGVLWAVVGVRTDPAPLELAPAALGG
ncbi:MAG TPA: hypothetical protein VEP49_03105 [Acidimicrobiia bacterium]|nr:hypothetical protein [Acidimicrobiia bacterium]